MAITSEGGLGNIRQKIRNAQVQFENGRSQVYPLSVLTENSLLKNDETEDSNLLPNPSSVADRQVYPKTARDAIGFHDIYIKNLTATTEGIKEDLNANEQDIDMLNRKYDDLASNVDLALNQSAFALQDVEYNDETMFFNSVTDEAVQVAYSNGSYHTYVLQGETADTDESARSMFSYGKTIVFDMKGMELNVVKDNYSFAIGNNPRTIRYVETSSNIFSCDVTNSNSGIANAEWMDAPCEGEINGLRLSFQMPSNAKMSGSVEEINEETGLTSIVELDEDEGDTVSVFFRPISYISYHLIVNGMSYPLETDSATKLSYYSKDYEDDNKYFTITLEGENEDKVMHIEFSPNFIGETILNSIVLEETEKLIYRNYPLVEDIVKYVMINGSYTAKLQLTFSENSDENKITISEVKNLSGQSANLVSVGKIYLHEVFLVN